MEANFAKPSNLNHCQMYCVYGIMFGESEWNANWQTFSLVKRMILSVDCLTDIHNTHDYK